MNRVFRHFAPVAVLLVPVLMGAQEGESVYKSRCAVCHGPSGEGKIGPALKATKLSEDDIVLLLSKGQDSKKAPHKKPMSSLSNDQVKAVAHYIKSLK